MNSALVVIDAQNGYCHPAGVLASHSQWNEISEIGSTISRIVTLRDWATAERMPDIYWCANKSLRDKPEHRWDSEIVVTLRDDAEHVFWRDLPKDDETEDRFFEDHEFSEFIREEGIGHFYVSGFFADRCVARFLIDALRRGYAVTIVTDCTFPEFDAPRLEWFNALAPAYGLTPGNFILRRTALAELPADTRAEAAGGPIYSIP